MHPSHSKWGYLIFYFKVHFDASLLIPVYTVCICSYNVLISNESSCFVCFKFTDYVSKEKKVRQSPHKDIRTRKHSHCPWKTESIKHRYLCCVWLAAVGDVIFWHRCLWCHHPQLVLQQRNEPKAAEIWACPPKKNLQNYDSLHLFWQWPLVAVQCKHMRKTVTYYK